MLQQRVWPTLLPGCCASAAGRGVEQGTQAAFSIARSSWLGGSIVREAPAAPAQQGPATATGVIAACEHWSCSNGRPARRQPMCSPGRAASAQRPAKANTVAHPSQTSRTGHSLARKLSRPARGQGAEQGGRTGLSSLWGTWHADRVGGAAQACVSAPVAVRLCSRRRRRTGHERVGLGGGRPLRLEGASRPRGRGRCCGGARPRQFCEGAENHSGRRRLSCKPGPRGGR